MMRVFRASLWRCGDSVDPVASATTEKIKHVVDAVGKDYGYSCGVGVVHVVAFVMGYSGVQPSEALADKLY